MEVPPERYHDSERLSKILIYLRQLQLNPNFFRIFKSRERFMMLQFCLM